MQIYPAAILRLLLPAALIGAGLGLRAYSDQLSSEFRVVLEYLPYLLCVTAAFMAYQFNHCRLMLAALGLAVFYWLIQTHLQVSLARPEADYIYLAACLASPLLCLYLIVLPETGLWNLRGLIASLAFVFLALACVQLANWLPGASEGAAEYYRSRPAEGYVMSYGASLLTLVVLLAGMLMLLLRDDETVVALLGVLAGVYFALAFLHLADISIVMCVAAGLCLMWGLLRNSHAMAYRDELTGLLGRRALNERLARLGRRYSIGMIDIDHFKRFNDKYGHDVGDEVLRMVAARIARVGNGGTAYRYGGEEFCVVFPRRSAQEGAEALESVRDHIAAYPMSIRDRDLRPARSRDGARRRGATRLGNSQVAITVSAGVSERSEELPNADAVVAAADQMLYRAKKAGRNRVLQ
jgi:diguanylate cyclase (GGDEF)-like protein